MTYRRTRKRRVTTASSDESLERYIAIKRELSRYLLDGIDNIRPTDSDIAWLKWYSDNFYTEGDKAGQKIKSGITKGKSGYSSNVTRIRRRMVPHT